MTRWALVRSALVANVAVVDSDEIGWQDAQRAAGFELLELGKDEAVQPGYGWDGSKFIPHDVKSDPMRGDIGDSLGDALIESSDAVQTVVNDWKADPP